MDTAGKFARYCARATQHLGDLIDVACTINESNMPMMIKFLYLAHLGEDAQQAAFIQAAAQAFGISRENFSPFLFTFLEQGRDVILEAQGRQSSQLRQSGVTCLWGITLALQDYQAVEGGESQRDHIRRETQDVFLEAVRHDDFVGSANLQP